MPDNIARQCCTPMQRTAPGQRQTSSMRLRPVCFTPVSGRMLVTLNVSFGPEAAVVEAGCLATPQDAVTHKAEDRRPPRLELPQGAHAPLFAQWLEAHANLF